MQLIAMVIKKRQTISQSDDHAHLTRYQARSAGTIRSGNDGIFCGIIDGFREAAQHSMSAEMLQIRRSGSLKLSSLLQSHVV